MVAQVDEDQATMVAPAIDPAGQANFLSDMLLAKLAAGVGAIGVHGVKNLRKLWVFGGLWGAGQVWPGRAGLAGFSVTKRG
jgi:hypothetical protein